MNYEMLSSLLKIVGYAGALFVLVSTVGLGIVNDKLDKVKEGKIDDLILGKNSLLKSVDDYKHQVEEKQNQIDELKAKAVNSSRGVSRFRQFDGSLRVTSAGSTSVAFDGGYEESIFPNLIKLIQSSKWAELESLCTEAITKAPDWMTLYFYRGLARANQGNLKLAKSDLDFVIENVGDSPEYSDAKNWLVNINQHLSER